VPGAVEHDLDFTGNFTAAELRGEEKMGEEKKPPSVNARLLFRLCSHRLAGEHKMKPITRLALVAIALGLAGCAYRPIVDPKRSDMARYENRPRGMPADRRAGPGPRNGAAVGAAVGYGVGQVFARTTGARNPNYGARGGAVLGAAGGAGRGARDERQVIRNCMTGRGHAVLN